MIARSVPPMILGSIAGFVADHFDRRIILISCDLLRALIVLGLLLVDSPEEAWLIYLFTTLQFSVAAFEDPAHSAIISNTVDKNDLIRANLLLNVSWSMMMAVGTGFGGLTAATLGFSTVFVVNSMTYLFSAFFVSKIHLDENKKLDSNKKSPFGHMADEFLSGFRYLVRNLQMAMYVMTRAATTLIHGGMIIVHVEFARHWFPIGEEGSISLSLIYLFVGLGTGAGPFLVHRITRGRDSWMRAAIPSLYFVSFLGFLMIGNAGSLELLLLGTFLRSVEFSVIFVLSSSMLQAESPNAIVGRVFAVDMMIRTVMLTAASLAVGWCFDFFGLGPHQIARGLALTALIMSLVWVGYLLFRRNDQAI